ncbi:hypothetical protein C6P42_004068, partial [Pichia californica]
MSQNNDLIAWKLIQASENYISKAHQIGPKILHSNNLNTYNTLIKASINCLFKVLRNYSSILDAKIQSILYYKVSYILFKETISSDLALDYCLKGIQITKRNEPNLTLLKLKLQYLNFQIQFNSNFSKDSKISSLNYINNLIKNEIPNHESFNDIKFFFKFIKFKYFSSIHNIDRNIIDLQNLYSQLNLKISKKNYSFNHFILINLIELQILNLNFPIDIIKKNILLLKDNNDYDYKLSIQYKSIIILFNLLISLREYDFNNLNQNIQKIDDFLKLFKSNNNNSSTKLKWQNKINFNFQNVNIIDSNLFNVEFNWLSFKDFSIISYFYCGILYSFKSWNNKNKSNKIFNFINSLLIESNLFSSNISFEDLQIMKIKQNFIKILISSYQLLSDFIKDKYPLITNNNNNNNNDKSSLLNLNKYKELSNFIDSYNSNNNLSTIEIIIYNNLIPLIQYIFAMIHQRNSSFIKSLYYYTK